MKKIVNDWNFRYSLGTPVLVFWEYKRIISTITRSKADIIGNKPVVFLVGFKDPYDLNMIKPLVVSPTLSWIS